MKFEIFYSEDYNAFTLVSEKCKVVRSLLEDDAVSIHSFKAANFEKANDTYQKEILEFLIALIGDLKRLFLITLPLI